MKTIFAISLLAAGGIAGTLGVQALSETDANKPTRHAALQTQTKASAASPVVVELFTSQGCSSCPPADRLAAKLVREDGLLVITRPVTYWDRLGWKDTLALPANTALQRAYAKKGHKGAGVYTPQIVVNGVDGAVGSRESKVRALIESAKRPRLSIAHARAASPTVIMTISGDADRSGDVKLLALDSSETVRIGRGENGGRTVTYTNVVREERDLGRYEGGVQRFRIPERTLKVAGADHYAVLVQRPVAGPIVGAAKLQF